MNFRWHAEIKDPRIREILEEIIPKLEGDPTTKGIFLRSSYALGVVTSQSDLDVGVITEKEPRKETLTKYEIPVHIHYFNSKVINVIKKDEKDPDLLLYLPVIESFSNIVPLSDRTGVVSSLQQEALKKKLFFARVHIDEMGKQINDAHGFFQKGAYEDAILNIRKAAADGILAFLGMAGMPSAKEKYVFSLLSSCKIENNELRNSRKEIIQLLRKIHQLDECNQDIVAQHLLSVGRMFQILSTILEKP